MKNDVKSEDIIKIMGFTPKTAASIVSKMGYSLRRNIDSKRLAKPIKHFIIQADDTEEELIKKQEAHQRNSCNRKKVAISLDERRLLSALTRRRTEVIYG